MDDIQLKRAKLEDFNEVLEIERATCSKIYFCRKTEKEVKDFIINENVYLIKSKDITVGIIACQLKNQDCASIHGLVIKPEYRNKGIARKAFSMLIDELKTKKRIDLPVHPHNSSAIILDLSLGFVIESWKDNYYGDGEPRIILVYQKAPN